MTILKISAALVVGFLACAVLTISGCFETADIVYTTVHYDSPDEHGREVSYVGEASFGEFSFAGGADTPMTVERELNRFLQEFKENRFLTHRLNPEKPISKITIKVERRENYPNLWPHVIERIWP